jgi:hypothetical protein
MKLTQSELDTLSAYQSQLVEMRASLRTFDLPASEMVGMMGGQHQSSELQGDFYKMHNQLSSIAATMQRLVEAGA